jgi:predicted Fe-Mo cluster-binding NifX family protein
MKAAFPTNDKKNLAPRVGMAKGFLIVDLRLNESEFIDNPVIKSVIEKKEKLKGNCGEFGLNTGQIVPNLLKEKEVDIFVGKKIGEGMDGNLDYLGIKTFITKKRKISEIMEELKEIYGDR